jgi:hypothetical protein
MPWASMPCSRGRRASAVTAGAGAGAVAAAAAAALGADGGADGGAADNLLGKACHSGIASDHCTLAVVGWVMA